MSADINIDESTFWMNEIARQMFVATADQNYILARTAYFNELDVDFFWLSAHALEKYLKAILLLNGRSAKNYGHNIIDLYEDAKKWMHV